MSWIVKSEEFDRNRFGYIPFMIVFHAAYAGVVALLSIYNQNWIFVSLLALTNMGALSMFLAQAKAKVCLAAFYTSLITSTVLLLAIWLLYYL